MNPSALLAFERVSYTYPEHARPALCEASLSIAAGQRVALVGRNGCGKSTLLLHANGILRPDSGSVRFDGQALTYDRRGLRALRSQVGAVFQHPDEQLFSASVAQDISFGPLNLGLDAQEVRRRVARAVALCALGEVLERPTHALSGGQKTRVALAGVLAMEPRVLLADEVTTSLDPWMRRQVFAIFRRLTAQGTTIVLATHDIEIARRWADQVVVMAGGRVLAADTPERIFADPLLRAAVEPLDLWDFDAADGEIP